LKIKLNEILSNILYDEKAKAEVKNDVHATFLDSLKNGETAYKELLNLRTRVLFARQELAKLKG